MEAARHSVGTKEGATAARIEIRMLLEDYESRNNRLQEVMFLIEELVKQIPMAEKLMEDPLDIKKFDRLGYGFREDLSSELEYVFERKAIK